MLKRGLLYILVVVIGFTTFSCDLFHILYQTDDTPVRVDINSNVNELFLVDTSDYDNWSSPLYGYDVDGELHNATFYNENGDIIDYNPQKIIKLSDRFIALTRDTHIGYGNSYDYYRNKSKVILIDLDSGEISSFIPTEVIEFMEANKFDNLGIYSYLGGINDISYKPSKINEISYIDKDGRVLTYLKTNVSYRLKNSSADSTLYDYFTLHQLKIIDSDLTSIEDIYSHKDDNSLVNVDITKYFMDNNSIIYFEETITPTNQVRYYKIDSQRQKTELDSEPFFLNDETFYDQSGAFYVVDRQAPYYDGQGPQVYHYENENQVEKVDLTNNSTMNPIAIIGECFLVGSNRYLSIKDSGNNCFLYHILSDGIFSLDSNPADLTTSRPNYFTYDPLFDYDHTKDYLQMGNLIYSMNGATINYIDLEKKQSGEITIDDSYHIQEVFRFGNQVVLMILDYDSLDVGSIVIEDGAIKESFIAGDDFSSYYEMNKIVNVYL